MDRYSNTPSLNTAGVGAPGLSIEPEGRVAAAAPPLVALLLLGASAADFAYLQAVRTPLALAISVPAGSLAGRLAGHQPTVALKALRAAAMLSIPLIGPSFLVVSGRLGSSMVAAGSIVGTVAYSVAAPALFPAFTPRLPSEASNRWLELLRSSAIVFGPALGGVIAGLTGASTARVLMIGLPLLVAVPLLSGVARSIRTAPALRAVVAGLKYGTSFVAGHGLLRSVLVTAVFFNFSWFIVQDVYVVYAARHHGMTQAELAATSGIYVAGMLAAGLATPRLAARMRFRSIVAVGRPSA